MIYQEVYQAVLDDLNESLMGFFPEDLFCRFWDRAQTTHFNYLDGQLGDYARHDPAPPVKDAVTKDVESRLSPFLKVSTVILTDGIGQLPHLGDRMWAAPRTVAASGYKKKCGSDSTAKDRRYPVHWKGPTEFNAMTTSAFKPKVDKNGWQHWPENQIKVTPLIIHAVEVMYYVPPAPPTPATLSGTIPWGKKDCDAIIKKTAELAAQHFGADGVVQYEMGTKNQER